MLLDLGRPCTSQSLPWVLVEQASNETLAVEGEITWDGSRAVENSSMKFRGEEGRERERERESLHHTIQLYIFNTTHLKIAGIVHKC